MNFPRRSRTFLSELSLLQREMTQLFERLSDFDRAERPAAAGEWVPSADVFECRDRLMVVVEVPGLAPDAIRVVCKNRSLVISGERRERKPAPGAAAFLCMERPSGRFTRTIPLDMAVDVHSATATLEGGLLTIVVPRLKDRRNREIVIPVERQDR